MTRFRLATYNVHKCKGVDWRVSPHRVADVICGLKCDAIATQEILLSQAETIATRTRFSFVFGEARQHNGEPYGNAVFTRLPILADERFDLTAKKREPRQCLQVSFALKENSPVHLFALHLGTSFLERRDQARRLVSSNVLGTRRDSRVIAGDFNEWTHGLASRMLSEQLRSADIALHLKKRRTYPGMLPFMHLDHIYYDPEFSLQGMHLDRTRLALLASDHLPLVADFEKHDS